MDYSKMNPSRVFTPEQQCSWGGFCMALYNVESPGGVYADWADHSWRGYSRLEEGIFSRKARDCLKILTRSPSMKLAKRSMRSRWVIFHSGRHEY